MCDGYSPLLNFNQNKEMNTKSRGFSRLLTGLPARGFCTEAVKEAGSKSMIDTFKEDWRFKQPSSDYERGEQV